MDNGNGFFDPIKQEDFSRLMQTQNPMVFQVGETIEVRGSRLKVESIKRDKIVFKLLKSKPT